MNSSFITFYYNKIKLLISCTNKGFNKCKAKTITIFKPLDFLIICMLARRANTRNKLNTSINNQVCCCIISFPAGSEMILKYAGLTRSRRLQGCIILWWTMSNIADFALISETEQSLWKDYLSFITNWIFISYEVCKHGYSC